METLDDSTRRRLTSENIDFAGSRFPDQERSLAVRSPILSLASNGKPIFRFSYNAFYYEDLHPVIESEGGRESPTGNPFLKELATQGLQFFRSNCDEVLVPENGLLIWDNHRLLHARSKYDDKARHLVRYWVK